MTAPSRPALGRPPTLAQKRALVALVRACPEMGQEVDLSEVARISGLKPNAAYLALRGLVNRKMALRYSDPERWTPTLSGRGMAKYVRAREPRSRPVASARPSDG